MNAGWAILFLITTQMIGYGLAGLYRDILVRPPQIYYPGVLPNVALFNAMHKNPAVTKKSLRFFTIVACSAFVYQWFPQLIFPLLSSIPLLCYFGHGNWIAFILGSGYSGFVSAAHMLKYHVLTFTRDSSTFLLTGTMPPLQDRYTPHSGLTSSKLLAEWQQFGSSIQSCISQTH
jgi:hypothetical protein